MPLSGACANLERPVMKLMIDRSCADCHNSFRPIGRLRLLSAVQIDVGGKRAPYEVHT